MRLLESGTLENWRTREDEAFAEIAGRGRTRLADGRRATTGGSKALRAWTLDDQV